MSIRDEIFRDEIFRRHSEALGDLTTVPAVLAKYVLRNALLDLEVTLSAAVPHVPEVSFGNIKTEVSSEAKKAPTRGQPGRLAQRLMEIDWLIEERLNRLGDADLIPIVLKISEGRSEWGKQEKDVRLAILRWVVTQMNPKEPPTMREFDRLRPVWMPTATGLATGLLGGQWREMNGWWAA